MQGDEGIAVILRREGRGRSCRRLIEGEAERRRMRDEQRVRQTDLTLEIRTDTGLARVFMVAEIIPRPAEELAIGYARKIVRHKIVTQHVAFIGGAIEVVG